ncbi:acyltransferase family protein [Spirosoma sp. KCTC 42546]|uniref:acyltransferase family protein n=1 Tax=Spirosoma sp. KCTC 42546 TaxID=2520506 RepID=UPI00143DF14B|nr:acyltransferase [Spirosoma sp. KCTC 42546]
MGSSRAVWLDYLRSFVTLLVLAHHAALAYPTFAYFDPTHYIYSTAPIVDDSRWLGMDRFIGFNDLFFMPLMFLISGLFVYRGLRKKGIKAYLTDRFIRLGVPFLIAELLLIPLAYVPSFYVATHSTDLFTFVEDYIGKQQWPVGPPWFIWLLLAFDGVAVLIFNISPSFFSTLGNKLESLSKQPVQFGVIIYGLTAISLIPLSLWVGQYTWVGNWGPFDFQLNRLFFYLLFFLLGACLGSTDWQGYLFRSGKLFGKGWAFWLLASLICYLLVVFVSGLGADWVKQGRLSSTAGYCLYDVFFVVSCLASMGACLAVFKQNITQPNEGWASLSANAYGIYILHYPFITWAQFALLGAGLPVIGKFLIVFLVSISLSWLSSSWVRRNQLATQVL